MYRRGCTNSRCKGSTQIQKSNRFPKRENDERRSSARSIDASCPLKNLGSTGVNVQRAVVDRSSLLHRNSVGGWAVVVPTCAARTNTAKMIPSRRMWAAREVNTCQQGLGRENAGSRNDLSQCICTRRLRKFGHDRSLIELIECQMPGERNNRLHGSAG